MKKVLSWIVVLATLLSASAQDDRAAEVQHNADELLLKTYEATTVPVKKSRVKTWGYTGNKKSGFEGGDVAMSKLQSGTNYIQALIQSLGITDNQLYGVGGFETSSWDTDPHVINVTYPWGAVSPRSLTPTNGYKAVSPYPELYRGQAKIWCPMPKGTVSHTNVLYGTNVVRTWPAYYIARFKYNFRTNGAGAACFFRFTAIPTGVPIITLNHAPSTNWAQVTVVITNTSPASCYWMLVIGANSVHGPSAELDAVQFIKIPGPSTNDFAMSLEGNVATVEWNTLTYIPGRFYLQVADTTSGPWTSNTVAPVITDYVARMSFTNTTGPRFFRMASN